MTLTITFATILISNSTIARVAADIEDVVAVVVEDVPKEVSSIKGRGAQNLVTLPGQWPKGILETLSSYLYILFDMGVLLSFISSQLVDRLHLVTFLVDSPFSVTSLLGRSGRLCEMVR